MEPATTTAFPRFYKYAMVDLIFSVLLFAGTIHVLWLRLFELSQPESFDSIERAIDVFLKGAMLATLLMFVLYAEFKNTESMRAPLGILAGTTVLSAYTLGIFVELVSILHIICLGVFLYVIYGIASELKRSKTKDSVAISGCPPSNDADAAAG